MLNINVHKTILLQILKEIYSDTSLGPVLGFKGGTAVFMFYALKRFSVDLDFDLLDIKKEEQVYRKIEQIAQNYGHIKEKRIKRNTIIFIISYTRDLAYNIKLEISKRSFGSKYELKNYFGISMLVMQKDDIFAHKLVALLERTKTANRDIFDVHFFLKNNWEINTAIVEKRTGRGYKEHLQNCINFLNSSSNRNILSGMGELLDEETKKWAKTNLIKDTLFLLNLRLEQIN